MAAPEKLGLWDRFFNRYRREIIEEIHEPWYRTYVGYRIPNSEFTRSGVKYRVIDRVTGSETIEVSYHPQQ